MDLELAVSQFQMKTFQKVIVEMVLCGQRYSEQVDILCVFNFSFLLACLLFCY